MPWSRGHPRNGTNYKSHMRNRRCYRWPAWRVGLKQEDLFDDLYDRFNTTSIRILDPEAFHKDVYEVARRSSSKDVFYARLRWRMEYRLAELQCFAWALRYMFFPGGHQQLNPHQSLACHKVMTCPSMDSLVAFLSTFVSRNRFGQLPSESKHASRLNAKHKGPFFFGRASVPSNGPGPTSNTTEQAATPAHEEERQSPPTTSSNKRSWRTTDFDETGHDTRGQTKRQRTDMDALNVSNHILIGTKNSGLITTTTPVDNDIQKEDTPWPASNTTERAASPPGQEERPRPPARSSNKRSWQNTHVDETCHDARAQTKRRRTDTDASNISDHILRELLYTTPLL
ncbi:hypothetical protein E4U43_001749 [Claviceps pusilla]|uniref:Uncharacterized protein n=1 Tax=Claviceps pusilla TaxID=123648 RepID=A0A9P7SYV6_9HYPO|nr:hypothetical protein E4U43_001749 [Claviceps pusilla]